MNLGERIYTLRTQKNLTQGDLAEALDVSRQSISKWETNNAIPEVGKLVQLSELFGVSLDELVKGTRAGSAQAEPTQPPAPEPTAAKTGVTAKQVGGIVLLGIALLLIVVLFLMGGGFLALVFAGPFLLCGAICLLARRHTGLWCAWSVYLCVDWYLRYATGINWRMIFQTIGFQPEQNYVRLAIGWAKFAVLAILFLCTLYAFRKTRWDLTRKKGILLACGWLALVGLKCLQNGINRLLIAQLQQTHYNAAWEAKELWANFLGDYLCIAALLALLIWTFAAILRRRKRAA